MSKRKNRTLRAGSQIGLNPYGWGNGRGQIMRMIKNKKKDGVRNE